MPLTFSLSSTSRRCLVAAFWMALVMRIAMLFQIPITDNSESRYAEMARWMSVSGNWITPEITPGVPFWAKPPLSMWVSAAGIRIFGENSFGARLPIFLVALATLWLIHRWATRLRGADFALAGTFILFTSVIFVVTSGTVMTDLVMAASTTLCMVSFWNAIKAEEGSRRWNFLLFLGLGIGLLAKGPISTVLTLLPIGIWAVASRQVIETWKRIPWIRGGIFALLLAAPWYIAAEIRTPGFLDYFIVGEHFKRFLVPGWTGDLYGNAHTAPRGMIWLYGFAAMMPWSLVLLVMGPAMIRRRESVMTQLRTESAHWLIYLLAWTLAPFLFFTLSRNIISTYTLTGVPAAALLIPELWRLVSPPNRSSGVLLLSGTAAALLLIGGTSICYLFFEDQAPKASERRMIQYVDAAAEFANSEVNYLYPMRQSAIFYNHGRTRFIHRSDIETLLQNDRHDLLVARNPISPALQEELSRHFRKVITFGDRTLYSETPPQPDVRTGKN